MRSSVGLLSGLLLAVPGVQAHWDTWDTMQIEVNTPTVRSSYTVDISNGVLNSDGTRYEWQLGTPVTLEGPGGAPVATIAAASYVFQFSPRAAVEMDFTILGGAEPIEVYAQSPVLTFPEIGAADARARGSIAFTLTDANDGFAEFMSLATPLGIGAFRGRVNGDADTGSMFAHLIYQMSIESAVPGEPAGTANANEAFPGFGFGAVGVGVSSLSTDVSFSLTPGDLLVVDSGMELSMAVPGFSCAGDLDMSGDVTLTDLSILLISFGKCTGQPDFNPDADLDGDGCTTLDDLAGLLQLFGSACEG